MVDLAQLISESQPQTDYRQDPNWIQGQAMLWGDRNPQKALVENAQMQALQADTQEKQRRTVLQKNLPLLLKGVEGKTPQEAFAILAPIDLELATEVSDAMQKMAKEDAPLSPQGKLQRDLELGNITQEQFDMANGGKSRDALKKLAIPGYELDPEVMPDPATARSARELATTIPSFENAVQKVNKLIDKYGSTTGWGSDVNDVDQAFADLMNAERSLNNTGVLNVGELPILEKNYQSFDPRNPINLGKTKKEMKDAALSYLKDRKGILNAKLKAIGYHSKEKETENKPSGSSGWSIKRL